MVKITVSEQNSNNLCVAYVYNSLSSYLNICGANADITFDDTRTNLIMATDKKYLPYIIKQTEEKIAEVIAVGYKYNLLKKNIKPIRLNELDTEVLLCALVSADFNEDKKYIIKRLKEVNVYSIDGFYNFRLQNLKRKWQGIIECIPNDFTPNDLCDFINYLFEERGTVTIKYNDGKFYDKAYNRLNRAELIDSSFNELNNVRELLLSGATKLECNCKPDYLMCEVLNKYYRSRTDFII